MRVGECISGCTGESWDSKYEYGGGMTMTNHDMDDMIKCVTDSPLNGKSRGQGAQGR